MSENTKLSDLLSALSSGMSDEDLLYAGIAADIAYAITSKRIDSGLTQKEFADRLGKSQALISKWENADCNFTLKSLIEIAQKLDMKLDVRLTPNSSASAAPAPTQESSKVVPFPTAYYGEGYSSGSWISSTPYSDELLEM